MWKNELKQDLHMNFEQRRDSVNDREAIEDVLAYNWISWESFFTVEETRKIKVQKVG